MQIKRVWALNLYGGLDLDFKLHQGINLLVGINGSGKTTALNIINWLLTLNIEGLATTEFTEVGVELSNGSTQLIKLRCSQSSTDMHIHGQFGTEKLSPIHVRLHALPLGFQDSQEAREELRQRYSQLSPEPSEEPLWSRIMQMNKPLAILLDRTIAVQEGGFLNFDDGRKVIVRGRTKPVGEPTNHVQSIARDRYAAYQSQLIKLNDKLKAKLITSSFETGIPSKRTALLTLDQITTIEKKLQNRMSAWNTESADTSGVKKYFQRIREVVESLNQSSDTKKSVAVINKFFADEMKRITSLSDAFDEFESSSKLLYEPLRIYLESLNHFFRDSGKELIFSDTNNKLYFRFRKTNKPDLKSVSFLSSGERQLLILLTYIAFPPSTSSIFIIDEPELSLHPKWQHELLSSIEKVMGSKTQMIIATHSPEIVGRNLERCVQMK